jgi:Yip1 domain
MEEQITNQPTMSEPATLANIFFEPGRTFESLRIKPKFILGTLIILILMSAFQTFFIEKVGFENIVKAQISSNPMMDDMEPAKKKEIIDQQASPVMRTVSSASLPVVMIIFFLIGGLIYWLAGNAMGGSMTFLRGISTWIYSSLPPTVVSLIANMIVLAFKSVDDIDILASQRGVIQANPAMFFDGKTMPVLTTLISSIDLFQIWGIVLAAIGLKVVGKISTGSAWGIVLILSLIGIAFRVVGALLFGAAM